jgi:hypothetical protein
MSHKEYVTRMPVFQTEKNGIEKQQRTLFLDRLGFFSALKESICFLDLGVATGNLPSSINYILHYWDNSPYFVSFEKYQNLLSGLEDKYGFNAFTNSYFLTGAIDPTKEDFQLLFEFKSDIKSQSTDNAIYKGRLKVKSYPSVSQGKVIQTDKSRLVSYMSDYASEIFNQSAEIKSRNGKSVQRIISFPIAVRNENALKRDKFIFIAGVFAGFDDRFNLQIPLIREVLTNFATYSIGMPNFSNELIESTRKSKEQQFAHIIQGQLNAIAPIANNCSDDADKRVAMRAIRRIRFAVDLFDDSPIERTVTPNSVNFCDCLDDAYNLAFGRLNSRAASNDKLFDAYFSVREREHYDLRLYVKSLLRKQWNNKEGFLEYLGISGYPVELSTQFNSDLIHGVLVYILNQVLFHGAVYAAYNSPEFANFRLSSKPTRKLVAAVKFDLSAQKLVICNAALQNFEGFSMTNDGESFLQLQRRFGKNHSRQEVIGVDFNKLEGIYWFCAHIFLN